MVMRFMVLVMDLVVDLLLDVHILWLRYMMVIVILLFFHNDRNVLDMMMMEILFDRDHLFDSIEENMAFSSITLTAERVRSGTAPKTAT